MSVIRILADQSRIPRVSIQFFTQRVLHGGGIAQRLHFSVRCGAYRGFQRVQQVRVSVFRVGDGQRGRRRVAVAPVNGSADAVNVKSQPEHSVRLIELDVLRQDRALFPRDAHTEVQIVREVWLVRESFVKKFECGVTQCALRLWRAVVWHGSCANILLRFRPGPGYHVAPPRMSMISGALFFLALTLHRLTPSVDLTTIYHNVSFTEPPQTPSARFYALSRKRTRLPP